MAVRLKWNGNAFLRYTEKQLAAGLAAAGLQLHTECRRRASVLNAPVRKKRTRDTSKQGGGAKGSMYSIHPNSSKPGESPRVRTGTGRANIVWGFSKEKMAARVGYTKLVPYMLYHELGVRSPGGNTAQRPTIIPSYVDNIQKLFHTVKRAAQSVKP